MASGTLHSDRIARPQRFPLWLPWAYSVFVCVLIVFYWRHYGPANFLWFSDIALFGALAAMWLGSRLLASMMLLSTVLPEIAWNIDYFIALLTGWHPAGMTRYMFDRTYPLFIRALSLFHVFLVPLLLWMVWKLGGYDRRALAAQTALAWGVLLATYFLTDPQKNINWTFGFAGGPQDVVPSWAYLLGIMIVLPLAAYLPMHLIFLKLLHRKAR